METQARVRVGIAVALLSSVLVVGSGVEPARAASITVNTAADIAPDGNGNFPNDGLCSLRAAIRSAQNNSNAHDVNCSTGAPVANVLDTITISPSLAGQTMTLSYAVGGVVQPFDVISGDTNPMMIVGPTTNAADFTISGGNAVRPFLVGFLSIQPGVLTLANLTVTGGNAANGMANAPAISGDGGAMYAGYFSHLTFDNVVFRNNSASARGGAVYAQAPTITNDGGAYSNNAAATGGAVFIEEGPATFNGYAMLLAGNTATSKGGGIATNPGFSNPFIHLERSLLRNNTAPTGGVIYIEPSGPSVATTVDITDSTITGNSSVFASTATTQRFNFERNTFVNTGNLFPGTGGGFIRNSIISGSTCTFSANVANYVGTRNLVPVFANPGDCGVAGMNPLGAVTGLSATLAQNGGPEVQQTFALLAGSNAIDNGSSTYCGTIDARSVARGLDGNGSVDNPQVGDCDIGAYEYAKYVVNFQTGTSSVNENAGTVNIPVKLRILDPSETSLPSPVVVGVANHPASTATPGALGDFTITNNAVTFPTGSVDGAVANLVVNINQDDVAELFGELSLLDLQPTAGVSIAEPKRHNLSIQDDDQAGVIVDDGGNGTTVAEATTGVADSITVRLQSRPDRQLLNPAAPGDPASYGAPANVQMTVTPDRDCTINDGVATGTSVSPLTLTILNANWQTGKAFTVNAINDLYDEDLRNETAPHTCELRFTFDSLDPIYDATQDAYDVTVIDDDTAGVNVNPVSGGGVLAEGSSDVAIYAVSLDTPPDPGKPLPFPPRGPTGVVLTPSTGCTVGAGAGLPVTFNFTTDNFAVPQQVEVRPADNLVVELLHPCTVATTITSDDPVYANLDDAPTFVGTPAGITEQVQDYDPPGITNDPPFVLIDTGSGVAVDEDTPSSFDTVSVVLERAPLSANVTVTLAAADDPLITGPQLRVAPLTGVPGPSVTLTFTPANWNVPKLVEVHAVDDDYDEDDTHSWNLTATMASTALGFNDATLRRIVVDGTEYVESAPVSVSITDNDTSAVVPLATAGSSIVAENGGTDTVTVQLATHPYADVTVEVTADPQCTVDGGATATVPIAAADWNVAVPLTVAAVDDVDLETNPHPCVLSFDASSTDGRYDGLTASQSVDVIDDEVAEVVLTTAGGLTVTEAGPGTDTFDVVLSSRPSADVTVTFAHDGQTTSAPSATFTPLTWDTTQTVTVTAVDDDIDEPATHPGTITLGVTSTAIGYDAAPVLRVDGNVAGTLAVAVTDDDTAGTTVTPTALDLAESGPPDTYTVVLTSEPVGDVTIALSATGLCAADAASLTFTAVNWDQPRTVEVTPGNDDIVHAQSCAVSHIVTSGDALYDALAVADAGGAVTDDDVAGVSITAGSPTLHEATGATATYTVALETEPVAEVTITIDVADGQTTVDDASLVFTAADWDTPQTVTVSVVDDVVVEPTPHAGVIGHSSASADPAYGPGAGFTIDGVASSDLSVSIHDDETVTAVVIATVASDRDPVVATASITGGDAPATGTVQFSIDGVDTGAPVTLATGTASVDLGILAHGPHTIGATYSGDTLHDGSAGSTDVVVVAAPVAAGDALTVTEDSGSTPIAVLANDTDIDGDTLTVGGAFTQGAHGTVSCTSAGCTYTPGANFNGVDSFTYTVTDGALSTTGTVHVTVAPVNDAPVPGTVNVTVVAGGSVTFDIAAAGTDVDGDALTITGYTQPAHGTVVCTTSGTCTYTPTPGYSGTDSFTYQLSDGVAVTVSAFGGVPEAVVSGTVGITVMAAPTPPTGGPTGTPSGGLPAAGAAVARMMMLALGLSAAGLLLRRRSHARPSTPS